MWDGFAAAGALRRAVPLAAALLLAAGCTLSYQMQPEPGLRSGDATASAASPDSLVRWFGPVRPGDRKTLAKWRAAVGPLVIDSVGAREFPAWRPGDSLAVVTWNAWLGGADVPGFLAGELNFRCGDRKGATGAGDAGFSHFVLLVQEANRISPLVPDLPPQEGIPRRIVPEPRPGPMLDIVEVAERCGLSIVYVPLMRNGNHQYESGREDKGNAILSTLPLSDVIAIELPFEAQRKMAVAATVRLGKDSLRAVSAHLDVSATLFRTVVEGSSTRARQALGLLQGLAMAEGADPAATPGDAPDLEAVHPIATVIGGDFNTWSARETAITLLRDHFPQSPPYDGRPSRGLFPTDFLFFRTGGDGRIELSGNRYRLVEELYYSDHHALIAWLKVRGDG